uniref:SAM domain and HD domain-containing protein 1 n=1 Tax=Magallana gigas TaxID=29159 RepID=K1RRU6_MAGGI
MSKIQCIISGALDDMDAYEKLTDSIVDRIMWSNAKSLKDAKDILINVQRRELYVCLGHALLPNIMTAQEAMQKYVKILEKNGSSLCETDVTIDVVKLNYGMKDKNPIDKVHFYKKNDPDRATKIDKREVGVNDEEDVRQKYVAILGKKHSGLRKNDVIIDVVNFNYGKKDENPIDHVCFYTKKDPNKADKRKRSEVSTANNIFRRSDPCSFYCVTDFIVTSQKTPRNFKSTLIDHMICHVILYEAALLLTCLLGDFLPSTVSGNHGNLWRALIDSLTHGGVAFFSWAVLVQARNIRGFWESLICGLLGMAIDSDHFIAARSLSLQASCIVSEIATFPPLIDLDPGPLCPPLPDRTRPQQGVDQASVRHVFSGLDVTPCQGRIKAGPLVPSPWLHPRYSVQYLCHSDLFNATATCTYLGRTYKTADRFPKGESCNMCTCRESGKVDCTTITCYQFPMYVEDDIHPHLPPPHRAMPRHDDPERTMNIMCLILSGSVMFYHRTIQASASCCKLPRKASRTTDTGKCRYNGLVHEAGSRFPSGDGCNECICTTLGVPQCTKYKCYPDCTYNGLKYKKGQTFPKGDNCNNYCTCTVTDCVYNGQTYSTGQEFQSSDGCRLCQCTADGSYTCSENYCLRDSNNLLK